MDPFNLNYNSSLPKQRIELQDRVRRLGYNPHEDDLQVVERQRQTLGPMLTCLRNLQNSASAREFRLQDQLADDDESAFDETWELASAPAPAAAAQSGPGPGHLSTEETTVVERQIIRLPSNGLTVDGAAQVELQLTKKQATVQVHRLRDLIAELSFQYSHVIRNAVRKSVRTQAQKRVKSLHNDLVLHARIYTRCRRRLVALDCDDDFLARFPILTKADLKASTAVLRPNRPGSTSLHLSWLWKTGRWYFMNSGNDVAEAEAGADPASLLECPFSPLLSLFILNLAF